MKILLTHAQKCDSLKELRKILESKKYQVLEIGSGKTLLANIADIQPDLLFIDSELPDMSGNDLCLQIRMKPEWRDLPILLLSGDDSEDMFTTALASGADECFLKPIRPNEILSKVFFLLFSNTAKTYPEDITSIQQDLERPENFSQIRTCNPKMLAIFRYCEGIAKSQQPVLITGETGVGKELMARSIYSLFNRGKFLPVNLAGIDENIFSDTLFGHVKGAFTGANNNREGLVEKASGGVLFMDEIGDMNAEIQVKLLRLLQEQEYSPVGSDKIKKANIKVIAATHRDIEALVRDGQFRKDLYYRLKTHHIHIPSLKERLDDIKLIVDYYIAEAYNEMGKTIPTYPPQMIDLLKTYFYPGNVRELRSMIYDALGQHSHKILSMQTFRDYIKAEHKKIKNTDILLEDNNSAEEQYFPTLKEETERHIRKALTRANGNQRIAAELLGISRQALNKRLQNLKAES